MHQVSLQTMRRSLGRCWGAHLFLQVMTIRVLCCEEVCAMDEATVRNREFSALKRIFRRVLGAKELGP